MSEGQQAYFAPHIITLPESSLTGEMDTRLSRTEADVVRRASCFVFRVGEEFIDSVDGPQAACAREAVLWRANHKLVCLLTYSNKDSVHRLYSVQPEGIVLIDQADAIASLRQSDLLQVVHATEGAYGHAGRRRCPRSRSW